MFLEECKYVVKEKKMLEHITDEIFSDDFDQGNSYEENSYKENSDEENFNEKKLSIECI